MYEAFYGLTEKPFNLTPDQRFLYLSDKHKEAFAHLLYGIKNRSGFVMVTGEIGTGKTTICRNLLNQLDEADTQIAFIFNPALNPVELLKKINAEFGVPHAADNVLELVEALNVYLLEAARRGKSCVLVIDEAQNLAPQVLEQIRLLSNLETETTKLLQIILIGQPELAEKLALHELRQLNQRITARYHLKPLSEKETLQYIAYRLHVAGSRRKVRFARAAIRAVFRRSGGTPRVVNAICDRALLIGYTKETHTITKAIVKRAANEIRGEKIVRKRRLLGGLRAALPSPTVIALALLIILPVFFVVQSLGPSLQQMARSLDSFSQLFALTSNIAAPEPGDPPSATAEASVDSPELSQDKLEEIIRNLPITQALLQRVQPEEEAAGPSAADLLAPLAPEATRAAALDALRSAWQVTAEVPAPESDDAEALLQYASAAGLSAERLAPALDQLLAVDLPALIRMKTGEEQYWVALTGAMGDTIEITLAEDHTTLLSRNAFLEAYAGEAVYWWRDANPNAPVLLQGRSGSDVARFKSALRELGRLPENNTSNVYDVPTASAVAKLQSQAGLDVDGIAGKQVRMVLSAWTAAEGTPRLHREAAPPEDTVEQTAANARGEGDNVAAEPSQEDSKPEESSAKAATQPAAAPGEPKEIPKDTPTQTAKTSSKPARDGDAVPEPSDVAENEPVQAAATPAETPAKVETPPKPSDTPEKETLQAAPAPAPVNGEGEAAPQPNDTAANAPAQPAALPAETIQEAAPESGPAPAESVLPEAAKTGDIVVQDLPEPGTKSDAETDIMEPVPEVEAAPPEKTAP